MPRAPRRCRWGWEEGGGGGGRHARQKRGDGGRQRPRRRGARWTLDGDDSEEGSGGCRREGRAGQRWEVATRPMGAGGGGGGRVRGRHPTVGWKRDTPRPHLSTTLGQQIGDTLRPPLIFGRRKAPKSGRSTSVLMKLNGPPYPSSPSRERGAAGWTDIQSVWRNERGRAGTVQWVLPPSYGLWPCRHPASPAGTHPLRLSAQAVQRRRRACYRRQQQ